MTILLVLLHIRNFENKLQRKRHENVIVYHRGQIDILWVHVTSSASCSDWYVSLSIAKIWSAQSHISYFSLQIPTQENVAALHIPVNDWWTASFVQIIQAYTYNRNASSWKYERTYDRFAHKISSWLHTIPCAASSTIRTRVPQFRISTAACLPSL
jgi:hypothetical protein